jgi:hypothetical protein
MFPFAADEERSTSLMCIFQLKACKSLLATFSPFLEIVLSTQLRVLAVAMHHQRVRFPTRGAFDATWLLPTMLARSAQVRSRWQNSSRPTHVTLVVE